MTYRDDLEAAQARITALERENSELKATMSEALVVRGDQSLVRGDSPDSVFWGGPMKLHIEKHLEGELHEIAFARIEEHIFDSIGHRGTVRVLPGSFSWSMEALVIRIASRDGTTRLRITNKYANEAAMAIFAPSLGGISGAAIFVGLLGPFALLGVAASVVPLWWRTRATFRSSSAKTEAKLDRLAIELVALMEGEIEKSSPPDSK